MDNKKNVTYNTFCDITFGDGKFIAVGSNGRITIGTLKEAIKPEEPKEPEKPKEPSKILELLK